MKIILEYIKSKPKFFTSDSEVANVKSCFRNSMSWVRKVANFPPKEARDIYFRYFPNALIDSTQKMQFTINEYVDYIDEDLLKDIENSSKNNQRHSKYTICPLKLNLIHHHFRPYISVQCDVALYILLQEHQSAHEYLICFE